MFNFFLNIQNNNAKAFTAKSKNMLVLRQTSVSEKKQLFNFFQKEPLFIYNNTELFLLKNNTFRINKDLIFYIYKQIGMRSKIKNFIVRAVFSIIITNSTIWLKNKITYWLKWIGISKHRRFVNNLIGLIYLIFFQFHQIEYKTQMFINVKGKLGIRGNNKKKKNSYPFTTNLKNFSDSYYFYDGKGSSSNHGHTFIKIKYKTN